MAAAGKYQTWSDAELDHLIRHFPDTDTQEMADSLGRTHGAVRLKAQALGIRKSDQFLFQCRHQNLIANSRRQRAADWTRDEEDYLLKRSAPPYKQSCKVIAQALGRSKDATAQRLAMLRRLAREGADGAVSTAEMARYKGWLVDEAIAHIVARDSIEIRRLDEIKARLQEFRRKPDIWWIPFVNQPVKAFLMELGL